MKERKPFFDIWYQTGEEKSFCYRTGLEVYEETLTGGMLVASGHNGAGYTSFTQSGLNSRLNHNAFWEPSAFHIEINGQRLDYGLEFVDFETERTEKNIHAVLTLDNRYVPVRLKIHTLLDGTQMFTRFIEIENRSDAPVNINRLAVLSGGLEGPMFSYGRAPVTAGGDVEKQYSLGYFNYDNWGDEAELEWHDLRRDVTCVDCRYGRDRHRHPVIFLRNNVLGRMYFMQVAWSGGCRFTVDYNNQADGRVPTVALSAEITSRQTMRVLAPKETYVTPEVHMGMVMGGLDDAVNEMHAHVRKSVFDRPGSEEKCYVFGALGPEQIWTVECIKKAMDDMAAVGVEMFVLDAGWECPPEDWANFFDYNGVNRVNSKLFPNGLDEVREYCHSLGMKFGLWVEIERAGKQSKVCAEHPEWRVRDLYGQQSADVLDFSNPEVEAWAEEELAYIISEYKLDLLRLDGNVQNGNVFHMQETEAGVLECRSLKHNEAIYRIFDRLRSRFPEVMFQNCASGGGRTDLGMMKYFHHTWVSDWQAAPRSVMITNGMTMALPPERVDRLFAGMNGHLFGSLDFQMRNSMLTHLSMIPFTPFAAQPSEEQLEFVKHSVEVYKNFIRKFLPVCRVYHHTDDVRKTLADGLTVLEIASPDHRMGALAAFTMPEAKENAFVLHPKGIDSSLTYRVTLDNSRETFEMKGSEIRQRGIRVEIPSSLSSELILWEAEA